MRIFMMMLCMSGVVFVRAAEAEENQTPSCDESRCEAHFGFYNQSAHACACRDESHPHTEIRMVGGSWTVTYREPDGPCGCHYPVVHVYSTRDAADEAQQAHVLGEVMSQNCPDPAAASTSEDDCRQVGGTWNEATSSCNLTRSRVYQRHYSASTPAPRPTREPVVVTPPPDVCPNLPGSQERVPDGMRRRRDGSCVTIVRPVRVAPAQVQTHTSEPAPGAEPRPPRCQDEPGANVERCSDCVATHGRWHLADPRRQDPDHSNRAHCDCGEGTALVGTECLGVEDVSRFCRPVLGAPQGTSEEQARHELLARHCTDTIMGLRCLTRGQIVGENGECKDPVREADLEEIRTAMAANIHGLRELETRVGALEDRVEANEAADREDRQEIAQVREMAESRGHRSGFTFEIRSGATGYVGPVAMRGLTGACLGGRGNWNTRGRWGAHLEGDWCFAGSQAVVGAVGAHYTYRHRHRFGLGLFAAMLDTVVDQSSDAEVVILGARLGYDYTPQWGWNHWRWGEAGIGLHLDISPEQTVTPTVPGVSSVGGGFRIFIRFR